MITSVDNARVKAARALHRPKGRRESGLCLLEGPRGVETALLAGAAFGDVFYTELFGASPRGEALLQRLRESGAEPTAVKDHVLQRLSDTPSPQGVVAVVQMQPSAAEAFAGCTALLIADGVSDPGNVGTMARSAAAAGAALWTTAGSTDLYDPKALRASAGTLFLIRHRQRLQPEAVVADARRFGLRIVVADPRGEGRMDEFDWKEPYALVIGSEARGPSAELLEAADARVRIPVAPGVESLNAAVTASICLFEAARQRQFAFR